MRALIYIFILSVISSCSIKEQKDSLPKYWCWTNGGENKDWDTEFKGIKDLGIGGILVSTSEKVYPTLVPLAEKYGLELHAWQIIMMTDANTAAEHPEWLSINRNGHSLADSMAYVPYYRFMCPILPEVKNHIREKIKKITAIEGVKGISLDYTRYVDVILPENLWSKYGIVQDKEYPQWDYGYHPAMLETFQEKHGYNPKELKDPSKDEQWKQFRYDLITDIANDISDITRESGKLISASPFPTPTIARKLVRQDWDKWKLDLVFPMIYNGMYKEEGKEWMEECIEENLQTTMADKNCEIFTGLFVPGHRKTDFDLEKAMATVLESGSVGISLFSYKGLTPEEKETVKAFIAAHP